MRFLARIFALSLLAVDVAFAGPAPAGRAFIERYGADYGLSADAAGEVYYQRRRPAPSAGPSRSSGSRPRPPR